VRRELESYDEYTRVVTHLDDKTRVIECRDGVQWIIQSASNRSDGRRTWHGRYFCRTKWALLHYAGVKPGDNATLDGRQEAGG
jgi:hypothetical protein